MSDTFDPNAPAAPGSGLFGLPDDRERAAVVIAQAPFDATTSYRPGAASGPAAVLAASHQVDLYDVQVGRAYEAGIHLLPDRADLRALSTEARRRAEPILAAGGATDADLREVALVDAAGARVHAAVAEATQRTLADGKIPGVLGGDHSVSHGAIAAVAEVHPGLGVLQVDAHADLRAAYGGFRYSHASVMYNVLHEVPEVARLVQVGIRDVCEEEIQRVHDAGGRVVTHFEVDWRRRIAAGTAHFLELCEAACASLPDAVYVSFDIDGLDPALCPNTGTPVPGGLQFQEACLLLETLQRSGRRIVGFDLTEVAPGPQGDEWDATVGARLLYKLAGFALLSRGGARGR